MILLLLMALVAFCPACKKMDNQADDPGARKLRVVASLFPVYDFARNIAGDKAEVIMLLPPGIEAHSFDPKPSDIARLNHADIFIYTSRYMEPWAEDILRGIARGGFAAVEAGKNIQPMKEDDHNQHGSADPHMWLDFGNAASMVDMITAALISADPPDGESFKQNAEAYKTKLADLDNMYRRRLSGCRKKTLISGGHFAFGYMAKRYGLSYMSAYGYSPDAEPNARNVAEITKSVRQKGLDYIFYEELLMPRMAETIARETGARLLKLHAAHNVTRDELESGVTFLDLMNGNLDQLMIGLQCR
jgi:zinc transport system substrate-binding protein